MKFKLNTSLIYLALIVLLSVSLISVLLRSYHAHNRAAFQIEKLRGALNGGTFSYGTLVSYDSASREVALLVLNRYDRSGEDEQVRYILAPDSYIGFQEIVPTPGAFQLTQPARKTEEEFAALAPGTRIKFFGSLGKEGYQIIYLLYGDPL